MKTFIRKKMGHTYVVSDVLRPPHCITPWCRENHIIASGQVWAKFYVEQYRKIYFFYNIFLSIRVHMYGYPLKLYTLFMTFNLWLQKYGNACVNFENSCLEWCFPYHFNNYYYFYRLPNYYDKTERMKESKNYVMFLFDLKKGKIIA